MVDSVKVVLRFDEQSDIEQQQCCFPYLVGQKTNENGEVVARFYERETIVSPVTGAKCKVRALLAPEAAPGCVAGYELEVNVPACMIGRNHLLVNGVPRAAESAVELLRYYAARRGCSPLGLQQFKLQNVGLASVTPTFLLKCDTPEQAVERMRELRDHADGLLNHEQRPQRYKDKKGNKPCYTVGADNCFSLYIKLREFKILAYIKQPNVPDAFETFPSAEVEQELVELALRTIRVEVEVHGKWLKENGLDDPEAWRKNPSAYKKVFQLVRDALRLDEHLRVRAPSDATIAKLPADHQTVLRAHLAGENIRDHELVLNCAGTVEQVVDAQNKKFSAFKQQALKDTGVDYSIPWEIQSTKLSPHLKNWFKYDTEFVPSDSLREHVFSRTSGKPAIAMLAGVTNALLANRPEEGTAGNHAQTGDGADLDDFRVNDPGLDDFDLDGLD
jgi:hypothetical protein